MFVEFPRRFFLSFVLSEGNELFVFQIEVLRKKSEEADSFVANSKHNLFFSFSLYLALSFVLCLCLCNHVCVVAVLKSEITKQKERSQKLSTRYSDVSKQLKTKCDENTQVRFPFHVFCGFRCHNCCFGFLLSLFSFSLIYVL